MNIIIKQREIEAGIKLYLLQQGIQLNGKTTEISFTAGRKDSGMSAEIEINDAEGITSVVDKMIQQQAPVAPVVAAPDPLIIPVQVMQVNHSPATAAIATEVTQPVQVVGATLAVEEEVVDPKVTAAVEALFAAPAEEVEAEPTMPAFTQALGSVFQSMAAPAVEVPVEEAKVLVQEDPAPWEAEEVAVPAQAPAVKTVSLFA